MFLSSFSVKLGKNMENGLVHTICSLKIGKVLWETDKLSNVFFTIPQYELFLIFLRHLDENRVRSRSKNIKNVLVTEFGGAKKSPLK